MAVRIAVLASGRGTNLQAIIEYHARSGAAASGSIELVAANRAGIGALSRASESGIPAEVFDSSDDGTDLLQLLDRHEIDLVVLAGYLNRIQSVVISRYRNRIINIHPGPLPDFGGAGMYGSRVHKAVLASGAGTTGATAHFVDDELDHGAVIAQWPVTVNPGDTPESLGARVLAVEHVMYPRVVDMVAALQAHDSPANS